MLDRDRQVDVRAIPTWWWLREALAAFGKLSLPLLVGLFVPGLALVAVLVLVAAPILARRIWPRLSTRSALAYGVGALLLMWAVPLADITAVGTAQCGYDAPGVLYPAIMAVLTYAGFGYAAVVRNRPGLWLLGSFMVPLVHGAMTSVLLWEGLARQLPC